MSAFIKMKGTNFINGLLTWKAVAFSALFLLATLEWRRNFGQRDEKNAFLSIDELEAGNYHNSRQLLKKLSHASTSLPTSFTTTTSAYDNPLDLDDNPGESASLAHWMEERQKVYEARQRRIDAICQKYNVSNFSSDDTMQDLINQSAHNDSLLGRHYVERVRKEQFLLSRANQLMGCLINKVASSSMVRMYLTLQGLDNKKIESPHGYRSKFLPESDKEMEFTSQHYFKFMLVRHPMERLVSCYYDKMVNGTHKSLKGFRKNVKMRAAIIRKQREGRNRGQITPRGVYDPLYFEQKAKTKAKRSIVAHTTFSTSKTEEIGRMTEEASVIPTLDDFLEFVLTDLSGEGFSSHWVPYWRMCTPCHFKYDMIGKLETGFDDFTFLWKKTQLDNKAPIPWYHAGLSKVQAEEKHLSDMKSFYSKVPKDTLLRVYQAYKLDFELFGYDFNQVLQLAGYEPIKL